MNNSIDFRIISELQTAFKANSYSSFIISFNGIKDLEFTEIDDSSFVNILMISMAKGFGNCTDFRILSVIADFFIEKFDLLAMSGNVQEIIGILFEGFERSMIEPRIEFLRICEKIIWMSFKAEEIIFDIWLKYTRDIERREENGICKFFVRIMRKDINIAHFLLDQVNSLTLNKIFTLAENGNSRKLANLLQEMFRNMYWPCQVIKRFLDILELINQKGFWRKSKERISRYLQLKETFKFDILASELKFNENIYDELLPQLSYPKFIKLTKKEISKLLIDLHKKLVRMNVLNKG